MIVSPASRSAATSLTTCPVTAAGTMIQTARGRSSLETRSAGVSAPTAPSPASVAIGAGSRFHTTISWPSRISRRLRLAPIRPRPIIPSCMRALPFAAVRRHDSAGGYDRPAMTTIRQALPDDAAAVTACVRAAYAVYVERIGREPAPMAADHAALIAAGAVWVAAEADVVSGVLVLHEQPPAMFVESVAVLPERQGRGLGRELLRFAESRARTAGLAEVTLYTNERMTENLSFYPALGYVETGTGHAGRVRPRLLPQGPAVILSTTGPRGRGGAGGVGYHHRAAAGDTPPLPRPDR